MVTTLTDVFYPSSALASVILSFQGGVDGVLRAYLEHFYRTTWHAGDTPGPNWSLWNGLLEQEMRPGYYARLDPNDLIAAKCTVIEENASYTLELHAAIAHGDADLVARYLARWPDRVTAETFACACIYGHNALAVTLVAMPWRAPSWIERMLQVVPMTAVPVLAVACNDADLLSLLTAHYECAWSASAMLAAIHQRCDVSVQYLYTHHRTATAIDNLLDLAAAAGLLSLVQILHVDGFACTTAAMDDAATNGHLEVVRFLHLYRNEGCTTAAMDGAASNGHLNVLAFLHTTRREGCSDRAIDGAAALGSIVLLEYLYENCGRRPTYMTLYRALQHGRYGAFMWMLDVAKPRQPGYYGPLRWLLDVAQPCLIESEFQRFLHFVAGAPSYDPRILAALLACRRDKDGSLGSLQLVRRALLHGHVALANEALLHGGAVPDMFAVQEVRTMAARPLVVELVDLLHAHGVDVYTAEWVQAACDVGAWPLWQRVCERGAHGVQMERLLHCARRHGKNIIEMVHVPGVAPPTLETLEYCMRLGLMDVFEALYTAYPSLFSHAALETIVERTAFPHTVPFLAFALDKKFGTAAAIDVVRAPRRARPLLLAHRPAHKQVATSAGFSAPL
ncbi:hypothetical protein SDRG_14343 [Saprolegnia diclina VS20]|uniref:Uncharacterized protein n=1 Tax=Saprolegnia diclina (strain VS20) TaxID=1156394 RepID=T0RE98_SAPDV|nr:hypothetical protein SDRG_14343 [Saprolegnia diclina VS20]EQC27922.1 hypothetical protein SDRG_14343 [Saprolegnia diclina VS20]|eukprot:XP_008618687.1 hypothetical protein SDRG_14343 [Saprolegnia diclina VS20]